MTEIAEITALLKSNNLTEALDLADRYLTEHPAAAAADPDSPAAEALEQARAVEDFFNPDLLNP